MELPVLHNAIGRGFSSNVLLIRMTLLSHRRFSGAWVVNQHAVHEARSKVATVVPNFSVATNRPSFPVSSEPRRTQRRHIRSIIVACQEDSPNAPRS